MRHAARSSGPAAFVMRAESWPVEKGSVRTKNPLPALYLRRGVTPRTRRLELHPRGALMSRGDTADARAGDQIFFTAWA
jgi:hypothetical protein